MEKITEKDLLEDKNELEQLKRFWLKFRTPILIIIVSFAVGLGGWKTYQYQQHKTLSEASIDYQKLLISAKNDKDTGAIITMGNVIMQRYSGTIYADFSGLLLANAYVKTNKLDDAAHALQWVVTHSNDKFISALASLRLANVYIATNKYSLAKNTLMKMPASPLTIERLSSLGRLALAQKDIANAKKYWQQALEISKKTDANSLSTMMIQMNLSSLPQ